MTTVLAPPISSGAFGSLEDQPGDPLLALIAACRNDPRAHRIDVGVGVYRDADGRTPVLRAVKAAEARLLAEQESKGYLGPEGDLGFFDALATLVLGDAVPRDRLAGLQTPGGTGALRLAFELAARGGHGRRVWIGTPTWANHAPIIAAAGLETAAYVHFDVAAQLLRFDALVAALRQTAPGDVVLLHGCCHNPTGVDFDTGQWHEIADIVAERGLLPLIDLAYQGLGRGLDEDAAGARIVLDRVGEGLVAYSCDKNFGLYRERTGALFALARNGAHAATIQSNLLSLARANWSMPPDHGAALVRIVLDDAALHAQWLTELTAMRERIADVRRRLADADPTLASLVDQHGLFSMLPLSPRQVERLREDHAIYMPLSGRINVAGFVPDTIEPFVAALAAVRTQ